LISVLIGIGTLVLLNICMMEYVDPFVKGCLKDPILMSNKSKNFIHLGIPLIDQLNCITLPFFKNAFKFKSTQLITGALMGLFVAVFAMGSVESLDSSKSFLVRFVPFWGFMCQALGVSVSFPLIWMTAYWMVPGRGRKTQGTIADFLSIKLITIGILLFAINCLSILAFENVMMKNWSITIFNLAPLIIPFIWLIPRKLIPHTRIEPGNKYVTSKIKLYYFLAGITTMFYYMAWKDFILLGSPFDEVFQIFGAIFNRHTIPVAKQPALFLMVDFLSLLTSAFIFDFIENKLNLLKSLKFILLSILLSPGTAFLLNLIQREKSRVIIKTKKE